MRRFDDISSERDNYRQVYLEELTKRKRRHDREVLGILSGCLVALVAIVWFLFVSLRPVEHVPYRCEDRGGIKQAVSNRGGQVTSLVCQDSTLQPALVKTQDASIEWTRTPW